MQEKSSHKAIKEPTVSAPREENVSAPKIETVSAPALSSFWYPGDETHAPIYVDAYTQAEAEKKYQEYLKR